MLPKKILLKNITFTKTIRGRKVNLSFIVKMWFCAAFTHSVSRMSAPNREDLIFKI